jgi:hypothetical protein
MPFFRTSGGSVMCLDVPPEGTIPREWHDAKLAAGELIPVDDVEQIGDPTSGISWRETTPAPAPSPRKSKTVSED